MHAQIVLFDGFDPLDVIAPFEVLTAGGISAGAAITVELVSAEGPREVRSGSGQLTLQAVAHLEPARADLIVVPGASGNLEPSDNNPGASVAERLAATTETALPQLMRAALTDPAVLVATVCGGSLVLAMAGLIEGRNAVTHHLGMDVLAATGVVAIAARVVDDGDLVSAGGVTSGLDLGLYLLDRCLGPRIALEVERLFAYERRGTVWSVGGANPVGSSAPETAA